MELQHICPYAGGPNCPQNVPAVLSPANPVYIGRIGVGWKQHCKTCRSLDELDHKGTVFFFNFGGRLQLTVEPGHMWGVGNVYSAHGE